MFVVYFSIIFWLLFGAKNERHSTQPPQHMSNKGDDTEEDIPSTPTYSPSSSPDPHFTHPRNLGIPSPPPTPEPEEEEYNEDFVQQQQKLLEQFEAQKQQSQPQTQLALTSQHQAIEIDDSPPEPKKMCPYGEKCYRKAPSHFEEYAHPPGKCSSES